MVLFVKKSNPGTFKLDIENTGCIGKKFKWKSMKTIQFQLDKIPWDICFIRFHGIFVSSDSMGYLFHQIPWDICFIKFHGIFVSSDSMGQVVSSNFLGKLRINMVRRFIWFLQGNDDLNPEL
ncbi:hypothetical protein TNCV_3317311 [Trichonephila clavipes]|nr:hypothetical protein TNCV_3317311 [Trichonephila clavipes]